MSDINPPRQLLLGTTGWARADWQADYYPGDLPHDWRISYFANDCDCVLLRPVDWRRVDATELATMLDDTPDEFRCFVDLGTARPSDEVGLLGLLDADRSVLLVDAVDERHTRLPQWPAAGEDVWQAPDGRAQLVRWSVDGSDLRALRVMAEALGPNVEAVVIDGPRADPGRIAELRTLLELLGKA